MDRQTGSNSQGVRRAWVSVGLIGGLVLGVPPIGTTLVVAAIWFWGFFWIPLLAIRGVVKMRQQGLLRYALLAALLSLISFVPTFALTFAWRTGEWESVVGGAIIVPCVILSMSPWIARRMLARLPQLPAPSTLPRSHSVPPEA